MKACRADLVYTPAYLNYGFGPHHPMQPERLRALMDLIRTSGLLDGDHVRVVEPVPATRDELLLIHTPAFLDAVQAAGRGELDARRLEAIGLGEGDTPAFPNMHETASLIAGGTLMAARAVMRGECAHAFNVAGGLHHAQRDRASGFCIYNDLSVAIAAIVQEFEGNVMYIDFDVHHGDGVQAAFYDDPRVLTVSFHETGRYLFPGTGGVTETGTRAGVGYSVNVPLAAFTQDDSWIAAIEGLLPALAERFRPDLIISQHGCDGHVWDEQAHLMLTTRAFERAARLTHEIAHDFCDGRWVATGGGGYDPIRVVPRAWALLWAEVAGKDLPQTLPPAWKATWGARAEGPLPDQFLDAREIEREIPRRAAIERENAETVGRVRELALSPALRQAYRPSGPWTPPTLPLLPTGRTARVELPNGAIHLRDRTPESLIRRMRVADGMHAFSRRPDKEARLLRRIASRTENNLVIAHTPDGEIVAELTLAPAEGRWYGIDWLYEVGIEVAPAWRREGLAEQLLRFAFEAPYVEQLIVIALGLSWHWDVQESGGTVYDYRDRLVRLFKTVGFEVYSTDDPEILEGDANVLLARVGRQIPHDLYDQFYSRLNSRYGWMG